MTDSQRAGRAESVAILAQAQDLCARLRHLLARTHALGDRADRVITAGQIRRELKTLSRLSGAWPELSPADRAAAPTA